MDNYVYFIWSSLFLVVWAIFYYKRKDLRKQMLVSSISAFPAGLAEILWLHVYWSPPSVFDLVISKGIGFEDFIYAFSIGGIVSVCYELLENKKDVPSKKHHYYGAFFIFLFVFATLTYFQPLLPAWNMVIGFICGAVVIAFARKDLIKKMIFSGTAFMVLSTIFLLVVLNTLSPDYVAHYYNHENLLGFNLLGLPIEEYVFAFTGGAFWSVLYEYVRAYKLKAK